MRIAGKQDVEASLQQVWAAVADLAAWERAALRRGAEVSRLDSQDAAVKGARWTARFAYRGRPRTLDVELLRVETPHHMDLKFQSMAIEGEVRIELIGMAARRTRLHVVTDLKPLSLGARLFLQSLRLARARVERRYQDRIEKFARDIEARASQTRG